MAFKIATQCYWYSKETNDPSYCRLRRDYIEDIGGCTYCYMDKDAVDVFMQGLNNLMLDKIIKVEKLRHGMDEFEN